MYGSVEPWAMRSVLTGGRYMVCDRVERYAGWVIVEMIWYAALALAEARTREKPYRFA